MPTVTVEATDLDIRALVNTTDSVNAVQSGTWSVNIGTVPIITVTATNLDIRDLVSATDSVSAVQSGTWNVVVSNFPSSYAVTGTFWQTTQPVSGTFWQTTQPVSGTFWQTTQPISGTITGITNNVNIGDISKGTQTNDVKITLDSETVELAAGTNIIGKVKVTNGTSDLILDNEGHIICLTHDQNIVHTGNMYTASHIFTAVADNGEIFLRILNSANHKLHFTFVVETEAKVYVNLYEGTTYDAIGTVVASHNNERSSGNTTDALLYHTPTVNTLGTNLRTGMVGSAGKFVEAGGAEGVANERILNLSEDYLVAVQNKGGEAKDIVIRFRFGEDI